jgi:DNA primase
VRQVLDAASNDAVRSIVTELSVEPLHASGEPDARYCEAQVGKIAERAVALQVIDLKSRLQRIDPTDAEQYAQVFGDLIVLEQRRRQLRDQAIGGA